MTEMGRSYRRQAERLREPGDGPISRVGAGPAPGELQRRLPTDLRSVAHYAWRW